MEAAVILAKCTRSGRCGIVIKSFAIAEYGFELSGGAF